MIDISRSTQNIFGILSEFGGILKILQTVFNFLAYPVAKFSMLLLMAKRLFFAKTERDDIFIKNNEKKSFYVKKRLSHYLNLEKMP